MKHNLVMQAYTQENNNSREGTEMVARNNTQLLIVLSKSTTNQSPTTTSEPAMGHPHVLAQTKKIVIEDINLAMPIYRNEITIENKQ